MEKLVCTVVRGEADWKPAQSFRLPQDHEFFVWQTIFRSTLSIEHMSRWSMIKRSKTKWDVELGKVCVVTIQRGAKTGSDS